MHPEGMPETPIWHPYQGAEAIFTTYPVVALCLPPANFSNRFAVKHTIHNYILHITMRAIVLYGYDPADGGLFLGISN